MQQKTKVKTETKTKIKAKTKKIIPDKLNRILKRGANGFTKDVNHEA